MPGKVNRFITFETIGEGCSGLVKRAYDTKTK